MSPAPPPWISEIDGQAGGLPVVLVEGTTDLDLLGHYFNQHAHGWDRRFVIKAAGNKLHVCAAIQHHRPDWLGIVDHDEWSPEDVAQLEASSPRLKVLPRFSIESYFCHPEEIWAGIPDAQRERVNNDPAALAQPIYAAMSDWTAHGAMWRVVRRMRTATHFPTEFDDAPVTDRNRIEQILAGWHADLAPARVLHAYDIELHFAQQLPTEELLKTYVHGKKFYRQVVVPILNHLFPPLSAAAWLDSFRDAGIQPSPDLKQLLDWVLSLLPSAPSTGPAAESAA